VVKNVLKLVNIWRKYGRKSCSSHVSCLPCSVLLKYTELAR